MHCKCDVWVWRSGRTGWTCRGGREWKRSRRVEIKVTLWKETSSTTLCPRSGRRLIPLYASKSIAEMHFKRHSEPTNIDRTLQDWNILLLKKKSSPFSFGIQVFINYFPLLFIYFSGECHENLTKNVNERNDIGEQDVTECVQRFLIMTASIQL